jgi:hypothetical protein
MIRRIKAPYPAPAETTPPPHSLCPAPCSREVDPPPPRSADRRADRLRTACACRCTL